MNSTLNNKKQTQLMGIVNLTPDSFSGDGVIDSELALKQVKGFIDSGVDIVDLGAESSRPGSTPLNTEAELARLLPTLEIIRSEFPNLCISIDTYRSEVATESLKLGANWINSIWGFKKDPQLLDVVIKNNCPVILMHNTSEQAEKNESEKLGNYYSNSAGDNSIQAIYKYFVIAAERAVATGLNPEQIIIDPGLGFGKTVEENLAIMRDLPALKELGFPLLLGPSRKSFIGHTLDLPVEERLIGTAACCALGIQSGVNILRIHDVAEINQVRQLCDSILK